MPTPMERAPEPDLAHEPIPKERYTSREFAALEWDRMWTKVWLLAGRESDIPAPGDYFSFEIGVESVLVVRQPDGGIAARHNVCMHRGNRLVEPGRGHVDRFSCAFHGWQYGLDGKLLRALDPETFPQGLPEERLRLAPVRCDTWAGFVFICLDPEGESLRDYLGVIPEHLDPYGFERWKVSFDCSIEVDCNWKTSVDAFNEAYHLAATHAWTIAFSDDTRTVYDCYDKHTRMIFPEVQASLRHSGANTATPEILEMFLRPVGVDVDAFEGGAEDARAAYAAAVRRLGPGLGADFSELNDSQICDDFHYTLFPNVTFNTHSLFLWVFVHRPHPDDPNRMIFDFLQLSNAPAQEIPRPERVHLRIADGDKLAGRCLGGEVLDEDFHNLPRIQRGMRSSAYEALHLGRQEIRILHFHKTLMDTIGRANGG